MNNQIDQLKEQIQSLLNIQKEQELTIKEGYKSLYDESPGSNPKDCLHKVVQMSQNMAKILKTQQKSLDANNTVNQDVSQFIKTQNAFGLIRGISLDNEKSLANQFKESEYDEYNIEESDGPFYFNQSNQKELNEFQSKSNSNNQSISCVLTQSPEQIQSNQRMSLVLTKSLKKVSSNRPSLLSNAKEIQNSDVKCLKNNIYLGLNAEQELSLQKQVTATNPSKKHNMYNRNQLKIHRHQSFVEINQQDGLLIQPKQCDLISENNVPIQAVIIEEIRSDQSPMKSRQNFESIQFKEMSQKYLSVSASKFRLDEDQQTPEGEDVQVMDKFAEMEDPLKNIQRIFDNLPKSEQNLDKQSNTLNGITEQSDQTPSQFQQVSPIENEFQKDISYANQMLKSSVYQVRDLVQTHEQSSKMRPEQIRNFLNGEVSQFPQRILQNNAIGPFKTVQPSPQNMILNINHCLEQQSKNISIGHQKSYKSLKSKPGQNDSQQQFIDHIFAKKRKWQRYQPILTSGIQFDSSSLLNSLKLSKSAFTNRQQTVNQCSIDFSQQPKTSRFASKECREFQKICQQIADMEEVKDRRNQLNKSRDDQSRIAQATNVKDNSKQKLPLYPNKGVRPTSPPKV